LAQGYREQSAAQVNGSPMRARRTVPASFSMRTDDAVRLAARWWSSHCGRGTAVVAHGFGGSQDSPQVVTLALALNALGIATLTYDSRGHGQSTGRCSLGADERHDVRAAVDEARRRGGPVVVVGSSMGAIASLRYAVDDPELAGVVSVSCPAVWRVPPTPRGVMAVIVTQTRPGWALASRMMGVRLMTSRPRPAPPIDLVEHVGAPVTFVHGARDRFMSFDAAVSLHARANEPRRLAIVPGMGHGFDDVAISVICDAVEWSLPMGGGQRVAG
jgi:pimeloyl-ACP methyl ester carboxylesterase